MKKQTYFCPACGELSNRDDVCSICGSPFDETAAAKSSLPSPAFVTREAQLPVFWVHVTVNLQRPSIPSDATPPSDLSPHGFQLEGNIVSFGSGRHQMIRLFDEGVSSRHGEFVRMSDGGWGIRDLGSTNGTFIEGHDLRENGRRLAAVPLGTIVALGMWTEFRIADLE